MEYVAFRARFKNTCESAIKNSSITLFEILSRHLIGNTAEIIEVCNYIGNGNRYEQAMDRLEKNVWRESNGFECS